jgi:hypothetical protein
MKRLLLILAGVSAHSLGSCAQMSPPFAGAYDTAHDMVDSMNILPSPTACAGQGKQFDAQTNSCGVQTSAWSGISPPSPEQQARVQAEQNQYEARVRTRAANCATGIAQNCLMYAQQQELRTQAFCQSSYGPAAHNILGYKSIGWPAEMTAEYITKYYPSLPLDLVVPLVREGYSGKWKVSGINGKTADDFDKEAQRRCLNGNPF